MPTKLSMIFSALEALLDLIEGLGISVQKFNDMRAASPDGHLTAADRAELENDAQDALDDLM